MMFLKLVLFLGVFVGGSFCKVQAMSLDWSGQYRFEWSEIDKTSLGNPGDRKSYGVNYLSLNPKIIASDGINVTAKLILLPNADYPNSQIGQLWGTGFGGATTDPSQNNGYAQSKPTSNLNVSQLYLSINQEYGAILLGRAPFDFGLGMVHSSGNGAFDHWAEVRDMVAYKFIVGDWSWMPAISKVYHGSTSQSGSITEKMFHLQYNSEDTGSTIGFLWEERNGSVDVNDMKNLGGTFTGSALSDSFNLRRNSFFLGRKFDSWEFKVEASSLSGSTGLLVAGEGINFNGYGIASELIFPAKDSKWSYNTRFGVATGNDFASKDFEGFQFNRNYDVSFLLFNHPLGRRDFLGTSLIRKNCTDAQSNCSGNSYDDETISNAFYFSPLMGYKYSEKSELLMSLTYARTMANATGATNPGKELGYEADFKFVYRPTAHIQWVNQIGMLMPGNAFRNGDEGLENSFMYGIESKAVISF